ISNEDGAVVADGEGDRWRRDRGRWRRMMEWQKEAERRVRGRFGLNDAHGCFYRDGRCRNGRGANYGEAAGWESWARKACVQLWFWEPTTRGGWRPTEDV
ncbi:hypothetical protein H0E87_007558, partial [Populus deltoides]